MQLLFSLFSSFCAKRGSMLSSPKTSCPFLPIFCSLLLSFTTFSIFCCLFLFFLSFAVFYCFFYLLLSIAVFSIFLYLFLSSSISQPSQPLLPLASAVFPVFLREFHPAAVRLLLFSRDIPDPF